LNLLDLSPLMRRRSIRLIRLIPSCLSGPSHQRQLVRSIRSRQSVQLHQSIRLRQLVPSVRSRQLIPLHQSIRLRQRHQLRQLARSIRLRQLVPSVRLPSTLHLSLLLVPSVRCSLSILSAPYCLLDRRSLRQDL
jgi:hypothetical protein